MRYRDLPYEERKKIVSLVFDEAERMKRLRGAVNYHELSKIVLMKTGVHLRRGVIWNWITGKAIPMGRFKAIRRPPDERTQIVRGLLLTDMTRRNAYHTIWLFLHTTKDFYARSVQNLVKNYGWSVVKPVLIGDTPEWLMSVFLDYETWDRELQKPIEELTDEEMIKLLSGAISGDGWIAINAAQNHAHFVIRLSSCRKYKAEIFHQVLNLMSIPHGFTRRRLQRRRRRIGNRVIQPRACYEYQITVAAKTAVKYLLTNLRLVHPFREVKRILALRFIEKGMLDPDLVKPVWQYLRVVEKYSTIRSQVRACEHIPDEEFAKKHLNKQWMLKRLRRKLYK